MLKQYSFLVYAKYIITVCQLHRYSFLIHYSCLFSGVLLSGYDVCITRFTVQQLPHYNKTLQLPSLRPPPLLLQEYREWSKPVFCCTAPSSRSPMPSMHRYAHSVKGLSRALQPIKLSACVLSLLGNHANGLALFSVLHHSYCLLQHE